MNKKRVIILMMDSLGVGSSKDAINFNDEGSNTFRHIHESYPMHIPNLERKGLTNLLRKNSIRYQAETDGAYGFAAEKSSGKDTISGHWEILGCPVLFDWTYFNQKN
jgi:phosphopentomutase